MSRCGAFCGFCEDSLVILDADIEIFKYVLTVEYPRKSQATDLTDVAVNHERWMDSFFVRAETKVWLLGSI